MRRSTALAALTALVLTLGTADAAPLARFGHLSPTLLTKLRATKSRWSDFRRTAQFVTAAGVNHIVTAAGDRIPLLADDDASAPDTSDDGGSDGVAAQAADFPSSVDLRPRMTPVKHQGSRNTCVAHATMAHLEAMDEIPDDLSEQDAHWVFMKGLRRRGLGKIIEFPHPTVLDNEGLKATEAPKYLKALSVCTEKYSPYEKDAADLDEKDNDRTDEAKDHAWYGVESWETLDRKAITEGPRMARLLAAGHTVVIAVKVAWDEAQVRSSGGVVDVVLDDDGDPAESRGGHAMLVVGYDVAAKSFIVRNSWGEGWGEEGYCRMTYDYLRTYGKYGFVVTKTKVSDEAGKDGSLFAAATHVVKTAARVALPSVNLLGLELARR